MIKRAWWVTLGANGMSLLVGVATGILAARLLGPEDRGLLAAVTFWPSMFASMTSFSAGEAVAVRVSSGGTKIANTLVSACVLGFVFCCLGIFICLPAIAFVVESRDSDVQNLALLFALAWLPTCLLATIIQGFEQGCQRFLHVNVLRLAPSLLYLVGILVLWASDAISVHSLAYAILGGSLSTVLWGTWVRRRDLMAVPAVSEIRTLLALGARFHLGAVLALLAGQADRMLLLLLFDDATVGHYVVAWTFASSGLATVTNAVAFVLLPVLAAEPDRARARALLATGLRRTALFLYLGVAASLAVTPLLVPLLFGEAFADAVPAAMLLLLATVPLTLRQTVVRCLRAFAEARIAVTSELAALLAFLLAAGPLALAVGANGIAAATIAGNLAGLVLCARHLARAHGIPVSAWLALGFGMLDDIRRFTSFARHTLSI